VSLHERQLHVVKSRTLYIENYGKEGIRLDKLKTNAKYKRETSVMIIAGVRMDRINYRYIFLSENYPQKGPKKLTRTLKAFNYLLTC